MLDFPNPGVATPNTQNLQNPLTDSVNPPGRWFPISSQNHLISTSHGNPPIMGRNQLS